MHQENIETILKQALSPAFLSVENESHMHAVPPNSETHFKVVIASDVFEGKRLVQRHQQIYGLLQAQLKSGVHALALHTYTPVEWEQRAEAPQSPGCAK